MDHFFQARRQLLASMHLPSPVEPLHPDWAGLDDIELFIKRDDLIHPVISGNKWRKLSPVITTQTVPPPRIISFGGGYSNHLHALGYLCHALAIPFTAIIRGNYQQSPTPMIADLATWGTTIQYVTKAAYRERHSASFTAQLQAKSPGALIIPEGGSQQAALTGTAQILAEQPDDFDTIICPVASGATLAGIVTALSPGQQAIGIAVLKGQGYLEALVSRLLDAKYHNWHIEHGYTHGGYAKQSDQLRQFCASFTHHTGIAIEPVYSGKLMFAVQQMLQHGMFSKGQRILLLHTGGLQGAR